MKGNYVDESLFEFAKRGRPKKNVSKSIEDNDENIKDTWYSDEDEDDNVDVNTLEPLETNNFDDDEEEFVFNNDEDENKLLLSALKNEIKIPEFNRRALRFKLKNDNKYISGVPMANIRDEAFLFKLNDGSIKKYFLNKIVIE
ncbi:hypothetical protein M0Q50_04950 [bacterium]|jgi:hypothetical protein|nr:hypothetical protein [bacterium]